MRLSQADVTRQLIHCRNVVKRLEISSEHSLSDICLRSTTSYNHYRRSLSCYFGPKKTECCAPSHCRPFCLNKTRISATKVRGHLHINTNPTTAQMCTTALGKREHYVNQVVVDIYTLYRRVKVQFWEWLKPSFELYRKRYHTLPLVCYRKTQRR